MTSYLLKVFCMDDHGLLWHFTEQSKTLSMSHHHLLTDLRNHTPLLSSRTGPQPGRDKHSDSRPLLSKETWQLVEAELMNSMSIQCGQPCSSSWKVLGCCKLVTDSQQHPGGGIKYVAPLFRGFHCERLITAML